LHAVDVEFTNDVEDELIDKVIDDMSGYYVKSKRLTRTDKFRIGGIVGIGVVAVILFAVEQTTYGTLTAILDVLITASQLTDLIKKPS
jgi:hypothetical protein